MRNWNFFALTLLALAAAGCSGTKPVTDIYQRYSYSSVSTIRDTTITLTPSSMEYAAEMLIPPCPKCLNASGVSDLVVPNIPASPPSRSPSRVNPKPLPPSDTIRVFGKYADAFAYFDGGKVRLVLKEGKEFEVTLQDAIRETERWKYEYSRAVERGAKDSAPKWFAGLNGMLVLILLVLIAIIVLRFL